MILTGKSLGSDGVSPVQVTSGTYLFFYVRDRLGEPWRVYKWRFIPKLDTRPWILLHLRWRPSRRAIAKFIRWLEEWR